MLEAASIDELKQAYIACSDSAIGSRLGRGGIMHCSVVYETLKRRAFGGDFVKLLVWSKAHPPAPARGPRAD